MSYEYDEDLYAEDPFANPYGYDEQAMVDYWVANGAGAGMIPPVQPGTGKALTVANRGSALNNYRSSLFDTAFMGLGGEQAFAPGAFEPTVTQTIKQTPELQQMYGYLRAPDSYEGLIANEILSGGNSSTALRKIRQLLADETTDPALRESLLLELPQRPVEYGMPAPDLTVENVNWDADERSVSAKAQEINELYAQIPRVGPSGPQWDPNTGQMISAGGQLQWGEDESGAPVMIEITETPSEAAQTFTDLGLPTPADEYTMEDFVSPETNTAFEMLPFVDDPVQQAMAQMMDPSLAPTNRETMTPYNEGYAPGLPEDQQPGGNRPMTDEERAAYALAKLNYDPNQIASLAGNLSEGVGALGQVAFDTYMGPARLAAAAPNAVWQGPLTAALGALGVGGGGGLVDSARGVLGGLFSDAPDTPAAAAEAIARMQQGQTQGGNPDQAAMIAQLIAQAAQGDESVDLDPGGLLAGGGWAGEGVNVNELMRRRAAANAPAVPPPPIPGSPGALPVQPDEYSAGSPATYDQFLAQPRDVSGYNFIQSPDDIDLVAQILGQQPAAPRPDYATSGSDYRQQQADAEHEAMLRQILPVAGPGPERPRAATPGGTPPYVYGGSTAGPGPEQPRGLGTGTTPPYVYSGGQPGPAYAQPGAQPANQPGGPGFQQGATQATVDAMLASILPGNGQRSTDLPAHLRSGAQPANQPGGPQYMEAIETGERRAAERQTDEQNAQVLGGSTDRTGKRVRPTRTGEQSRAFRAAMDQWHGALDQRNAVMQASWGSPEFGQGVAQEIQMRRSGVRPLDQALMARRLVLMNAGMPQGI